MAQLDEVKKILRSLLVSAPIKVTVASLNRDFLSLEGYNIPYRELGFNSLLHLLYSIPDVLRVNGSSFQSEVTLVLTEKVAHVSDMVMKQKIPTKGRNAHAARKSIIREPQSRTSFSEINVGSFKSAPRKNSNPNTSYDAGKSASTVGCPKILKDLSPFPRPLMSIDTKVPYCGKHICQNIQKKEINSHNGSFNAVSETIEDSRVSIRACTNNVNETLLPNCERVPSLVKHMPHNTIIKETSDKKEYSGTQSKFERLKLCRLGNTQDRNYSEIRSRNVTLSVENDVTDSLEIISFEKENSKVPIEIQNKLIKLIKFSSGIRCTELPSLYKKMFHRDLDYQTYGFDRLISLCLNLESIFYCEEESDCDFKLYDKDNPPLQKELMNKEKSKGIDKSNNIKKTIDLSQIKAVKSKDWDIYADSIPDDSIKLGEVVENNSLNDYVIEDTVRIVISEIYNPSKFWIYKNDGHLDEMMNSLQNFYKENKAKYLIPEFLIEVGLYCVVNTLGEFQRAIIVDLLQDIGGHVKVYLIDYGTLTNLSREKIWFLMKHFCTLPAQAVETNLSRIEPKEEGVWTEQCILRFKDMVVSKSIFAKILEKGEQTLSVDISVMSMPLITLNDLLVLEGYAKYIANCGIQDTTNNISVTSEESNPRKKLIDRIRLKKQMKH